MWIGFDDAYGLKTNTSAMATEWGIKAALEEINANGGVLGRPLRLSSLDTASRPEKAVRNVDKLADEGAVMLFGGASSAVAIAAGKRAKERKLKIHGTCRPLSQLGS